MATRIYFKTFASAGIVSSAFAVHGAAEATTLFADNFESYAPGSNLVGQGGWAALPSSTGGGVLLSNTGSLPTTVLDGLAPTSSGLEFIVHPLGTTIPSAVTTVLKFNALGINAAGVGHNSWVGLSGNSPGASIADAMTWDINIQSGGWQLEIRQSSASFQSFATHAGYNLPATLAISFDPIANEVWAPSISVRARETRRTSRYCQRRSPPSTELILVSISAAPAVFNSIIFQWRLCRYPRRGCCCSARCPHSRGERSK